MKRFIFVSFAFLAWAFYELSGGADFQPHVATAPLETNTVIATAKPPVKARTVKATTLVASPAIMPVVAAKPGEPVPAPASVRASGPDSGPDSGPVETAETPDTDLDSAAKLDQIRTSLSQELSLFPDSAPVVQPLMLASLEQGAAGLTVAVPVVENENPAEPAASSPPPADIREITGTRVNMRDGPGTIYPVITRLTIGHEVEVLGESGTGWLRLRTMPEEQIGWISASLVSKARR